jgi:hypothetical protein
MAKTSNDGTASNPMKLKLITIEIGTGIVHCQAAWTVQGTENIISFKLVESDLYARAAIRNEPEWGNDDVCALASDVLGISVII